MRKVYSDERGELFTEDLAGKILQTKITGYMSAALAKALVAEIERFIKSYGFLRAAHDWHAMTNYDGDGRTLITDYSMKHRKEIGDCHILLKSAMVNMGVNTASIALKAVGISVASTTDRATFEQRVAAMAQQKAA
ncbi:MAG: hypothetical protein ACOZQL_34630 [Myxococcota bacterium]